MRLGYNTNGFPYHRLEDTLTILAELGYQSVAITLDHHCLNPIAADCDRQLAATRKQLESLHLCCVVETGARFLLDPRRKHQPTLLSPNVDERALRTQFLRHAIHAAAALNADAVSFWSGTSLTDEPPITLMDRLVQECRSLSDHAADKGVRLAFEPEPGMFVDGMEKYTELHRLVNHPSFGLTLDVGHLHCLGEWPIAAHVKRWSPWLWNVHVEDMKRGVHEHLAFGDGEMDFPPILRALEEIQYAYGMHVELSRHGHDAVEVARKSMAFLRDQIIVPTLPRGVGQ